MVQIVLDTNIFVSGLISAENPPGRIIDGTRGDDRIFREYREVLARLEFARWIHPEDTRAILDHIQNSARYIIGALTIQGLPDPDDAPFAEVATMGGVPLVTGNLRHFPGETVGSTSVLTPRQFIETLGGRVAR